MESKLTLRPLLLLHTQSSPAGEGGDMRNIFQIYKNKWNIRVERQSTLKPYPCQRFVLLAQMKIILHVTVLLNCMSQSVISGVSMGTDGGRTVTVNTRRWLVPGPWVLLWRNPRRTHVLLNLSLVANKEWNTGISCYPESPWQGYNLNKLNQINLLRFLLFFSAL